MEFLRHGTGEFTAEIVAPNHPIMQGIQPFMTWDETYVHTKHNTAGRTVLMERVDADGREPWTWVRTQGKGRVFYTAYGHDERTWTNPGFQMLIDYRDFKTPRDLYDRLRAVGGTHVVWTPGRPTTSMQEEVIFHAFAQLCGGQMSFGSMVVGAMPATPPPVEPPYKVLTIGVPGYPDGLYAVDALALNNMFPPAMQHRGEPLKTAPSLAALIDEAKAVIIASSASAPDVQAKLDGEFKPIQSAPAFRVLLRK